MAQIVYIGDEVTAAGFRLAGLDTRVAGPGEAAEFLRQAVAEDAIACCCPGLLAEYIPDDRARRCAGGEPAAARAGA